MADLKLNFTGDDLEKPTPQKIMEVCDTFMDVAQGYIKDVVYLEDIQDITTSQNPVRRSRARKQARRMKIDSASYLSLWYLTTDTFRLLFFA